MVSHRFSVEQIHLNQLKQWFPLDFPIDSPIDFQLKTMISPCF